MDCQYAYEQAMKFYEKYNIEPPLRYRMLDMFNYKTKVPKDDNFIMVEDGLPSDDGEVMVIGRSYSFQSTKIGIGNFTPQSGWNGCFQNVFAWKPLTEQIKKIILDNPAKS